MDRNESFSTLDRCAGPGCLAVNILDPTGESQYFEFSPSCGDHDDGIVIGANGDDVLISGDEDEKEERPDALLDKTVETFSDALEELSTEDEEGGVEEDDDDRAERDLKEKDKLVFILSEAGKPIFCRYGNEERLVTLFGLMQALVFCVKDNDDEIRSVTAGGYLITFLSKGPLIYVAVSRRGETESQLALHLSYVQSLIVSVLTASQLKKIFEQRRNYDLRKLLGGADRLMDNLLNSLEQDPSYLLGAVSCLPLNPNVRELISDAIIKNCAKVKNVVFAILLADSQLVALVRMKKYMLHPADLHILINLVGSTESFKLSESWTPICLPRFNANGFLHAHVSYLADDCQACLLLLTVDKDQFFVLSEAKQGIVQRLRRHRCLEQINEAMERGGYSVKDVRIPEVRHFLYKARPTAQFTAPLFSVPYDTPSEKDRLMALYHRLHNRMLPAGSPRNLKLVYAVGKYECVLGWVNMQIDVFYRVVRHEQDLIQVGFGYFPVQVTAYFELYAAIEPLVEKEAVIPKVEKLLNWIREEENRLFILTASTF